MDLPGQFEGLNVLSSGVELGHRNDPHRASTKSQATEMNAPSQERPTGSSIPSSSSDTLRTVNRTEQTGRKRDRQGHDHKLSSHSIRDAVHNLHYDQPNAMATHESPRDNHTVCAADRGPPDVNAIPSGPVPSSQPARTTHFRPGLRQEKTSIFNADEKARLRAEDAQAVREGKKATFDEPEKTARDDGTLKSVQKNAEFQQAWLTYMEKEGADREAEHRAQQREMGSREEMERTKRARQREINANLESTLSYGERSRAAERAELQQGTTAQGFIHDAEKILHYAEQRAAGVLHDAEKVFHNAGEIATLYVPSLGAYFGACIFFYARI